MPDDQYQYGKPYAGLRFWVEIQGIEVGGFSECSGLSAEMEMYEHTEGGWNVHTYKLPVRLKYGNVTLKRGLNDGGELRAWFEEAAFGEPASRRDVTISLYNPEGKRVAGWQLKAAYPVKYTGPDFKNDAASIAVESLELAHHGIQKSDGAKAVMGGMG